MKVSVFRHVSGDPVAPSVAASRMASASPTGTQLSLDIGGSSTSKVDGASIWSIRTTPRCPNVLVAQGEGNGSAPLVVRGRATDFCGDYGGADRTARPHGSAPADGTACRAHGTFAGRTRPDRLPTVKTSPKMTLPSVPSRTAGLAALVAVTSAIALARPPTAFGWDEGSYGSASETAPRAHQPEPGIGRA